MGNKVLGWLKSNVVIVAAMAVAIIAIGVSLFFSMRWNSKIKTGVTAEVQQAVGRLNGMSVTYELPQVQPGVQKWSAKQPPNDTATKTVGEMLQRIAAESEQIRDLALQRNRKADLLVENLFPAPANESARVRLLTEMIQKHPAAHERLLRDVGAGMPPTREAVMDQITRAREREVRDRVSRRADQNLTPEEQQEITQILSRVRTEIYGRAAAPLAFYADPSVFRSVTPWPETAGLPTLETAWDWQHGYWIHQDLMAAFVKANTTQGGAKIPISQAPLKRVISIELQPAPFLGGSGPRTPGSPEDAGAGAPPPGDPAADIAKDFTRSFSGRPATSAIYDTREADVVLLADANRLVDVIRAINATNFMTVTNLDVVAVNPIPDLQAGFAYGNDYIVQARMRIETVWLRSWMKPWMPEKVRQFLGIPPDEPAAPAEGESPEATDDPQG